MVTVAHLVEKLVEDRPTVHEAIEQGIVSFTNLAEQWHADIERELGKSVKLSAIVMALRRYAVKIEEKSDRPRNFEFSSEILMKTGLCDISIVKTPGLFSKLRELSEITDYNRGEIFDIINGSYEVTIITNMRYLKRILDELKDEEVINIEKDLVALTLSFSKDFIHTPGIIYHGVRHLVWESVNIFEIVSTLTELTFIIAEKDAMKGYNALRKLVR